MSAAVRVQEIEIAAVDTSGRLRPINPAWVEAMADELRQGADLPPIEVVERAHGYRLIAGGHRIAAVGATGSSTILARVWPADAFADEAAIRLREIQENMIRYELTALDRAVHLAAWRELHEASVGTPKRGRKSAAEKLSQDPATIFVERFSRSAAAVLKVSERSIQDAIAIAKGISPAIRERIFNHPIASNASELRLLASQSDDRQRRIVPLLLAGAGSVADAIALVDRVPAPAAREPWERAAEGVTRLPIEARFKLFETFREDIDRWLAERPVRGR